MTLRNIHPVDELAETREAIKALQEREAELKAMILAGECSEVGNAYLVRVERSSQERLDVKALRELFGADALAPYVKRTPTTTMRVYERQPEELAA